MRMLMFGRLQARSDSWLTLGLVGRVSLVTALVLGMLASTALAHSHGGYDRRTATVPLPQIEGPIPVTDSSHIWNGAAWRWVPIDLSKYGYVEEEYYVSGRSKVYEAIPYSDYKVKSLRSGPYTTRITVRRPKNMKHFSGRVAVEIINMTAGYDWTANWGALWETIVKKGDVYVGITSKPNVFPGMVRFDPERYGRLSMANPLPPDQQTCGTLPDDPNHDPYLSKLGEWGLAFDIFSQVGALIKSNGETNPLGRRAKRSYLVGYSASGSAITLYFKWIHQLANVAKGKPVYDGYLIEDFTTGPLTDTILNQCAAPLADDDPQLLVPGRGVPLTVVNSEVFYPEVFYPFDGRKPDSNTARDKFALWMLPGASHGWTFQYDYSDAAQADLVKADLFDPNFPHFVCGPRQPEVNLYMAEKAMYLYLDRWVRTGKAPPHAPDPVVENGEYVRDADGNTLGGLRFPELQVPVATYTGVIVPSLDCTDAVNPFTQARIDELYSSHADYVRKYVAATLRLFRGGYILKEDAKKLIKAALARPIP
ncbi:MAG TPA: alpha/beta hydrolase domain-containing protein [Streptomyces sp.]|nr:alpha/beta hydrolase domain-containing protein [Streptomyces sp.]